MSDVINEKPAKFYYEWKSNDGCLGYWDTEKAEGIEDKQEKSEAGNVLVELPFKFAMFCEFSTIKGFHTESKSGIYSNEVVNVGKEEVVVKSFNAGKLIEGIYSKIKPSVISLGGKFNKSIYGTTEDGTTINLAFKGSALSVWSDFTKASGKEKYTKWIHIDSFEKKKKGNIEWTVPVFTLGKPYTAKESEMIVNLKKRNAEALEARKSYQQVEETQFDLSI